MKEIERLRKMDAKELAHWICNNILNDDCNSCPFTNKCFMHHNPIEEILEHDDGVKGKFLQSCIKCDKFLNGCKGKLTEGECLHG